MTNTQALQWINNFHRNGAIDAAGCAELKEILEEQGADAILQDLDVLAPLLNDRYFDRWQAARKQVQA